MDSSEEHHQLDTDAHSSTDDQQWGGVATVDDSVGGSNNPAMSTSNADANSQSTVSVARVARKLPRAPTGAVRELPLAEDEVLNNVSGSLGMKTGSPTSDTHCGGDEDLFCSDSNADDYRAPGDHSAPNDCIVSADMAFKPKRPTVGQV